MKCERQELGQQLSIHYKSVGKSKVYENREVQVNTSATESPMMTVGLVSV